VADEFTTLGYLIPVAAMFSRCGSPRGKFVHFLIQGLVMVCFGAASSVLMVFCCVKARQHTSSAEELAQIAASGSTDILSVPYNTAASVVAAVWLFLQTYIVNTLRGKDPQLGIPVTMHCMLFFVAATEAPDYTSVSASFAFVQRLLLAMLAGIGLATATHFLIFPDTSRDAVRKMMREYIRVLQDALRVHASYFEAMEQVDMFVRTQTRNPTDEKRLYRAKADAAKDAARKVSSMHAALSSELPFAKREVAYGKLGAGEFGDIFRHLRATMLPIVGLSTVVDVFDRVMEWNNWAKPVEEGGVDLADDAVHVRMVRDWNVIMARGHDHFAQIYEVMDQGLQHVAYQLDAKRRKQQKDVEAEASMPGEEGFASYLEDRCEAFYKARLATLREWCEDRGIALPENYFHHPSEPIQFPENVPGEMPRDRIERQLYILLYVRSQLPHILMIC
jgi:Putative ER transporter, 6TM, N-terminal